MRHIEVEVLNPDVIEDTELMMVCAARMTQRGHKIKNMDDFINLYYSPCKPSTLVAMSKLPHPTLQKFTTINVVVSGASRRFLAQITRHQNEVKFMSASLQYSDYSGEAGFVTPYNLLGTPQEQTYQTQCACAMNNYAQLIEQGLDNDSAGYIAPQGLRNVLIISATPFQWKHMISQRICRRNTDETRYVMLKIWEELYALSPALFAIETTGAPCQRAHCEEGKMSCGRACNFLATPTKLLHTDFPKLYPEAADEN